MRSLFLKMTILTALGLVLAAPAEANDQQFASTLFGAGLGGLIGNSTGRGGGRPAATVAGVFLGGMIGNEMGRPAYGYAPRPSYPYYAYPYDMFPTQGYYAPYQPNYVAPPSPPPPPPVTYIDDESGSYCREFSQQTRIGNQVQETYGTACLGPDGSWHIVQ